MSNLGRNYVRNSSTNNKAGSGKSINMLIAQGITKAMGGATEIKEHLGVVKFSVLKDRGIGFNFDGSRKANYVVIKQNKKNEFLYDMTFYRTALFTVGWEFEEVVSFAEVSPRKLRNTFEMFNNIRMTK